jgi:hypothetical protein
VLASLGHARPATSAVDVVVAEGASVVAPVSGTVVSVSEYPLFDRTRDWRIELAPEGRQDLRVVVVGVRKPEVVAGDEITAGETVLGLARVLPFPTAADAVTGDDSLPRTSISVRPALAEGRVDPNQPAAAPTDL